VEVNNFKLLPPSKRPDIRAGEPEQWKFLSFQAVEDPHIPDDGMTCANY
jgi:hypothetical protein